MTEPLLKAPEAAAILRISVATVYALGRERRLPGVVRVGRIMRFQRSELERFMATGGDATPPDGANPQE